MTSASYDCSCYLSKPAISSNKESAQKQNRVTSNSHRAGSTGPLLSERLLNKAAKSAALQKKIKHAEQQLANSATSSMAPSTSQTAETLPLKMEYKKMIAPGTRDAPKFSSASPEGLRRFIRLMEDLWELAGVVDDEKKKSMIGKYADEDCEEEWTAFATFGKGHSWEKFKKELIENYPEAAAAERGTPARIRQLCMETAKVSLGDMPSLYAFRRAFMAEARKLLKPPAAMANRELVELFIGCLTDAFASAVLQFLGHKMNVKGDSSSSGREAIMDKDAIGPLARRPEDRYDLDDVCKAAIQVSENSQGMFSLMRKESAARTEDRGVFLLNHPMSETKALSQKVEELEGVQALEKDRLEGVSKTLESKIEGLQDMMKVMLAQGAQSQKQEQAGSFCKMQDAHGGPTQKWGGKSMDGEKCYWCGVLGHFQADCEDLKNQVRAGNVKFNPEGRLRMKDGSFIPNIPAGGTLKEKVERHYSKKPSQYFYGCYEDEEPLSTSAAQYPAQFLHTTEDPEKRRARLERELDLREKEEALELKTIALERKEKKLEQASGSAKATNVLDLLTSLTEDELVAIKAARSSGFP